MKIFSYIHIPSLIAAILLIVGAIWLQYQSAPIAAISLAVIAGRLYGDACTRKTIAFLEKVLDHALEVMEKAIEVLEETD